MTHARSGVTLADYQYQFNADNQITQMTEVAGARTFAYDELQRLTSAVHTTQLPESYSYDQVGNRTASHKAANYSYQTPNRVTQIGSSTYTYDNNGKLKTKTEALALTTQYFYDHENRLTSVMLPNATTISYKYDALGRRIERNKNGTAWVHYSYDGWDVVREVKQDGSSVEYGNGLELDDHLWQRTSAGATHYFITDHQGSTRALADGNGSVVGAVSYDTFGNGFSSSLTSYGYTGREHDAETGLLYYRARWYDPAQGRFVSEDPIGLTGGINQFTYVENDPFSATDPLGLFRLPKPGDKTFPKIRPKFDIKPGGTGSGLWRKLGVAGAIAGLILGSLPLPEPAPTLPAVPPPNPGVRPTPPTKSYCSQYPSRSDAFQQAKDAYNVPRSQQPEKQDKTQDIHFRWVWLREWKFRDVLGQPVYIREDVFTTYGEPGPKGFQCPHFNAGYEHPDGLKDHFFMIQTSSIELRIYDDLTDHWQLHLINGWKEPWDITTAREIESLRAICALEMSFAGTRGDESLHAPLFESVYTLEKNAMLADSMKAYMIVHEAFVALKSRLRTYRGVFPKVGAIKQGRFIEHEIDLGSDTSLIVGITEITKENADEAIRYRALSLTGRPAFLGSKENTDDAIHSSCGIGKIFFASDDSQVFSADFLTKLVMAMDLRECWLKLHRSGIVEINFLNVVLSRCLKGGRVYRLGGDGGDREASLQIFMERAKLDETVAAIKPILGSGVREVNIGDQQAPDGFYDFYNSGG